jgi:hypothetical protein
LLAGVQVVRNATVAQYAESRPQLAARIWPSHPASELWLGLTQIGLTARQKSSVASSTLDLIRASAKAAPLSSEPFLVRGIQAQIAGDGSTAQRAFLAAKLRDGRSIPARYFLSAQYFKNGDARSGLREIAVLARMVPNGVANLAPFVAAFAKNPRNQPQLRVLFRSDPVLEQTTLGLLATDPRNVELIMGLATSRTAIPPQWAAILVQTMVNAGQYAEARGVWTKFAHVGPGEDGLIFNSSFEENHAPAPFNWTLTSSTLGLAERQAGGRLHIVYYGQEDGTLATQLLLLKPGRYHLAMQVSGEVTHAGSLSWSMTCAGAKAPLFSLALNDSKRAAGGVSFEVPPNCVAQNFVLAAISPDIPQQADVTISGLRLTREQSSG